MSSDVAELLHRAHEGRAWVALGYRSWKDYCKAEFRDVEAASVSVARFRRDQARDRGVYHCRHPQNESQTRALESVPAEKRAEVWERARNRWQRPVDSETHGEAAGTQPEKKQPEISGELRDEVRGTIAAALNHAWEELKVYPEMDWQLFRSGVRGWLKSK